jgi:hypothetical protein
MDTTFTLDKNELATLLMALGEYKSKMYQQGDYFMSHEASNLISKVKNGVKENV